MIPLLALLAAFLIGGIPFGYLLVRLKDERDVRSMGSGNIGATNVFRTSGRAAGLLTLALDITKGTVAVWIMERVTGSSPPWMSAAALAVMLGHAFPVFLKFRGGKAVASFVGAFGYLTPLPLAATLVVFMVTVFVTRYISLGSVLAAGCFPLAVFLIDHPPAAVLAASIIAGIFIVARHRANMERIRDGSEHLFSPGSRRI